MAMITVLARTAVAKGGPARGLRNGVGVLLLQDAGDIDDKAKRPVQIEDGEVCLPKDGP
jgi:hypothetical protein